MKHYENIEYDINFLIGDKDLFQLFQALKSMLGYHLYDQAVLISYQKQDFDNFINHELRISEESIIFNIKRDDIEKFQIILRKFNDQYICVRFALDFESEFIHDGVITLIVDGFVHEIFSIVSPVCITAGEVVVPYFIQEISNSSLEGDFLYLDRSLIDTKKLSNLPKYSWFFYGNGVMFSFLKNKNLEIYKVLKNALSGK